MDEILFDGYRRYQKSLKDNIIKKVCRLPIGAIVIFVLGLVAAMLGVVFQCVESLRGVAVVFLLIEVLACIVLHFYVDNFRIKTYDKRLSIYYEYCRELHKWINSTGFKASKQNIGAIKTRIDQRILLLENKRKQTQNTIWHIMNILIIPLLIAVFSAWIKDQTALADLITAFMSIVLSVGYVGLFAFLVYNALSAFRKRRIEQLRCFSEDLQGILDTQYEHALLCIPTDARKSKTQNIDKKQRPKSILENAGKTGTAADDSALCQMFDAQLSAKEICVRLKRSNRAVAARLVRLGKIKERKAFYR